MEVRSVGLLTLCCSVLSVAVPCCSAVLQCRVAVSLLDGGQMYRVSHSVLQRVVVVAVLQCRVAVSCCSVVLQCRCCSVVVACDGGQICRAPHSVLQRVVCCSAVAVVPCCSVVLQCRCCMCWRSDL